jgi:hypothetical protein
MSGIHTRVIEVAGHRHVAVWFTVTVEKGESFVCGHERSLAVITNLTTAHIVANVSQLFATAYEIRVYYPFLTVFVE